MALNSEEKPLVSLPGFTNLPFEIQIIILRMTLINDPSEYLTYLGDGEAERFPLESKREQLKNIRPMSRAFCAAVDPAVFASIHISASRLSLQRAENIANSSLAGNVKEIVYHHGSFEDRIPDLKLYISNLASHRRRQDYPSSLRAVKGIDFHPNYLVEIEGAKQCENLDGPMMTDILKKLPNLETYVCLPYHNEWHDPETSAYTLRRVGLSYLPMPHDPRTDQTQNFINAFWTAKITKLNLSLFPTLAREQIVKYKNAPLRRTLKSQPHDDVTESREWPLNLRYLKIGGDHSIKYGRPSDGRRASLHPFLSACTHLTHLELTYGWAGDIPPPQGPLILPGSFPQLQTLTLSDETFRTKVLKECLLGLATSLRYLHFRKIHLQSDTSTDWSPQYNDSIVELLFDVTPSMNLESCTGLDSVRCCKSTEKGLMVVSGSKPGKDVMVQKVQEAACKKRKWPKSVLDGGSANSAFPNSMKRMVFFSSQWDDMVDLFEETPYDWHTFVSY